MRSLFALAVLSIVTPTIGLADSDGYYCIGKGFVAYELFQATPPKHVLHVVRVAHRTGISRLAPIPLEDFQVHGMTCGESSIELQGWTTRYSIALPASGPPRVTSAAVPFDPKSAAPQLNLGMLARAAVSSIPSDGAPDEFQLVIATVSRPNPSGIAHYVAVHVIQRDASAPIMRQIVAFEPLYVGVRLETGG